jgi:hypothetical protein
MLKFSNKPLKEHHFGAKAADGLKQRAQFEPAPDLIVACDQSSLSHRARFYLGWLGTAAYAQAPQVNANILRSPYSSEPKYGISWFFESTKPLHRHRQGKPETIVRARNAAFTCIERILVVCSAPQVLSSLQAPRETGVFF